MVTGGGQLVGSGRANAGVWATSFTPSLLCHHSGGKPFLDA